MSSFLRGDDLMLKVAVIGLGDISKIHIPIIQENPNVELVAVCDINEALKDSVRGCKILYRLPCHD